jgi:eukaryotic-like serine/threonine-protein kinase
MTQPRLLGGRYELDGVVGRGGMAEVYRARDIRLDRIVAIKTLRTDLARDQTFQARFRREAQSAASLNHPSIVAVYDTGEDMATGVPVPYIVMEFVDGRTVRDLLQEGHRLLPERSLEIIDGVLRALEYSHQAGIVHRDIKPGNVMVTRNGDIKVMDFGIARAMSDAQATMTQTAQVIGTAQYLSPEQARGDRVDARSDLYSAGCLLYELLTGRPPFTGDSPVAIAYQHVRENPIPPSRVDPDIPRWADAIVLKAMAKSPADRYQSAAEMRADLQRAAQGMPVAAAPPTRVDMYGPQTRQMRGDTMMAGATTNLPPVNYDEDYDGYNRRLDRHAGGGGGGRRWIPWLVGFIIVAGVVGFGAYYLLGSGSGTAVPLVQGDTLPQAQAALRAVNLQSKPQYSSNSAPTGTVFGTNPAGGTKVSPNTVVILDVSSGPAPVKVPNVVGQTATSAEATLQGANLTPKTSNNTNCTGTAGQVTAQSVQQGTEVKAGTPVTITVCGGGVPVPQNLIGASQANATQILKGDGFKVLPVAAAGPQQYANGTVWNVVPSAGTTVPQGSTVTIYVQNGASPTASPSTGGSPTSGGSPTAEPPSGGAGGSPGTLPTCLPLACLP